MEDKLLRPSLLCHSDADGGRTSKGLDKTPEHSWHEAQYLRCQQTLGPLIWNEMR